LAAVLLGAVLEAVAVGTDQFVLATGRGDAGADRRADGQAQGTDQQRLALERLGRTMADLACALAGPVAQIGGTFPGVVRGLARPVTEVVGTVAGTVRGVARPVTDVAGALAHPVTHRLAALGAAQGADGDPGGAGADQEGGHRVLADDAAHACGPLARAVAHMVGRLADRAAGAQAVVELVEAAVD